MQILKRVILASLLILISQKTTYATPGELDPDFGTNGFTVTTFEDMLTDVTSATSDGKTVIYLSNGKIMVGGEVVTLPRGTPYSYFSLTRYNSDGQQDSSFGNNGRILTDFAPNFTSADAFLVIFSRMAQRPDGNFVSVGIVLVDEGAESFLDYLVAVYNTDGSLDTTFNPSGALPGTKSFRINTSTSPLGGATDVSVQNDNRMIIVGIGGNSSDLFDFTTLRINTDGSLDTTFNPSGPTPGVSNINFGASTSADVALASLYNPENGTIITGGTALVSIPDSLDSAYAAYDSNGELLSSFGTNGLFLLNLGGSTSASQVNAMRYQSNGNIVSAGNFNTGFAVSRITPAGVLDTTFGSSGLFATPLLAGAGSTVQDSGDMDIAVNQDIFVSGSNNGTFAFIKVLADGSGLDTSYNPNGTDPGFVSTNFGPSTTDTSYGLNLQSDGKLLVVGKTNLVGKNNQVIARYLGTVADISTQKTASNDFPIVATPFTYTIVVSNAGPDTAEGVVVTDPLPSNLQLNTVSSSQGTCSGSSTIICSLGNLAINASATITLNVTPNSAGSIVNTATAEVQSVDPNPNNNTSTSSIFVGLMEGSGACNINANSQTRSFTLCLYSLLIMSLFLVLRKRGIRASYLDKKPLH